MSAFSRITCFDPRPRVGGDNRCRRSSRSCAGFDPRPRVGGDGAVVGDFAQVSMFRSAPPRGGRRVLLLGDQRAADVSIRAPAWGATCSASPRQTQCAFRSAPPRGGRRRSSAAAGIWRCFDPRPRVGGDFRPAHLEAGELVSIRAPAWGATTEVGFQRHFDRVSIRAPAWGATTGTKIVGGVDNVSIRAPAWGATGAPGGARRDLHAVSIRAPAWGATRRHDGVCRVCGVSIRAPAWGATSDPRTMQCGNRGFDPRPRVGGDHLSPAPLPIQSRFRSAPPRGGRQLDLLTGSLDVEFRSAPPRGGRRPWRRGRIRS